MLEGDPTLEGDQSIFQGDVSMAYAMCMEIACGLAELPHENPDLVLVTRSQVPRTDLSKKFAIRDVLCD